MVNKTGQVQFNIQNILGRLRLRFSLNGHRYQFCVGLADTKANRVKVKDICLLIESDIESGNFDKSLSKYKLDKKTGKTLHDITLSELFDKWFNSIKTQVDPNTIRKHGYVRTELLALVGDKPLRQFTKYDVNQFIDCQLSKGIKAYTIKRKLLTLSSLFDFAKDRQLVSENLFADTAKKIKVKQHQITTKPFTSDEVNLILRECEHNPKYQPFRLFIKFLFDTGTRTSEAIGLRFSDLSDDCIYATIREQLTQGVRKTTKTGKVRTFKLPDTLTSELLQLKQSIPNLTKDTLIFTFNNHSIDNHNFRVRIWKPLLNNLGIEYRKFYSTRHTFISHQLAKGINPVVIAKITGHDTKVLFEHYASDITDIPSINNIYDTGNREVNCE
jgi:integrase